MSREHQPGRLLIKNSMFSLFNNLVSMIVAWGVSVWVARQLGPNNYGIFSLVLWFSGSVSWVLGMGLIHATTKFIAEARGQACEDATPIVLYVLKIELILTIVATIALLFLRTRIATFFFSPQQSFFFFLAALGLLPGMITALFSATIEGIQKFEYFTWATLIISPLAVGAKVFVLINGYGIEGILTVMLIFSFVNSIFYFIVLRHEGFFARGSGGGVEKGLRRRINRYNGSVAAILICDKVVWDKSETFFLGRWCGAEQIAFYNLGFNIAQKMVMLIPFTFWKVLFPAMSHYFGSGDHDKVKRIFFLSTRYLAFVSFPIATAGAILAWPLLFHLYGHDFTGAQRALQIILLSSVFLCLANPGSTILYGYEKQAFIYKFGAILAVFNITLDILLIPSYGAVGAAVAYGTTTIIASVGGLFYTCRTMHLSYPIVSLAKIAFSSIIMGTVMMLITMKYAELPGTLLAAGSGGMVYLICSLVLGTFEQEDYTVLASIRDVLPGGSKRGIDLLVDLMEQFKLTSQR